MKVEIRRQSDELINWYELIEVIDFLYREKLIAAINALPTEERRVVELWLREVPIESNDENVLTMTGVLECAEKTVRNRRDRAFEKLREALKKEEDV